MNTKTIKFDLNKYKLYEKIKAKQGDTKSRFLLFQLLDGSIPFNLKNRSVRAYMIKPDGREIFNDLIVNNYNLGYCTLELTNQILAAPGTVKIELMVTEEDKKLTSSVFELEVVKSINSEKSIVSTNEFTALLNGLAALSEYDNYKNSVKEMEINKANKAEVEEKFTSVEEKIKNNSEQLDTKTQQLENEKATREELSIERNRISAIIQLPNGSTTGDAELMDGRITLLGNKEQTIGDSIRNQFKSILSSNSFSKSYNFDDNFNGVLMELSGDFIKGQNTMIILNGESGVLNESATINIGLKTINDELINDFLTIQANKIVEFIMPQNCKMFRCWIPSSAKKSNGVVTLTIGYKLNLYETLNKNYESLITQKELIDYCLKFESGENGYIYDDIYNISVLDGYDIDSSTPCNYKKDEIVYFYLENDGSVKDNVIFYFANTYENGDGSIEEIANEIALNPNTEFKFQFPKKCTKIRWWVSKSNVIKDGNIKLTVKSYRRNGFKNYFEENVDKLNEKVNNTSKLTFSILGDSYSAYPKWIEEGYASWYNDNGNTDTNNMTSFTQMWWYLLMQETGYALLRNESYSGTTISTTGYSGNDSTATSFTTRMKKGMGEERTLEPKPNIIFALGGQNDTWANSPIGDVKYSGWTTEDLKSTLPAFCYMIDYLKKWNPQARIINIMSDELKPTIKSGMITACNYYNVEYVQLTNISKENGHPSQQGMKDIKSQIIKIL